MPSRILIVDDHEAVRSILDAVLSQAGHDCMSASTGETAIEMARRIKFDLVILDVNMPRMSGLQVLERIRRFTPATLMVTADSNIATVRAAVELGCDGYVAKPIEPAVLLARVDRILAKQVVYL